ncbi:MAG TPA: DUF4238 domain-containing protein [Mycobacteriales bacterium]|nr:DUF4238 domain-containing protein [Mycobacteriales bacterium]
MTFVDERQRRRELPRRRRRGIRQCFAADDLYTLRFGREQTTSIEKQLFGDLDQRGNDSVAYWSTFAHPAADQKALSGLMHYMSAQKLRTPKGLDWLAQQLRTTDPNQTLGAMVKLRTLFASIWAESIWQIADASQSETKFIVTDHPVSVYNRVLGPRNRLCRPPNDPDIRLHGSHTIFPLGLDKVLILTNRSWARNPYQPATKFRPNPDFYRDTYFNFFEIQTHRILGEDEVRQINFILKSCAYRFIAAGRQEWLYPERHVSKSDWNRFGNGYLLMPEPRSLHHGAQMIMQYADGSSQSFDDFGRRPWQPRFGADDQPQRGRDPLNRFQAEFARLYGPRRRARSFESGRLDDEQDSEERHQYYLSLGR